MKLKWKIALPVLALLLLLILLVTVMNYTMTKSSIDQIIEDTIASNLDTLVSQIDRAASTGRVVSDEISNKNVRFAHVFAEIIRLNADSGALDLDDVAFFEGIAALMNVTEINVTDGAGNIVGSNLAENYGFNYGSADSTLKYMQILDNPSVDIIEEPRASAVSGDMYQYMGTARTDAGGFVQVGFDANAVREFQDHLDIVHTAADMRVGSTGRASIIRDGIVAYSQRSELIGQDVTTEEVRNLASKSADAAKDTGAMIQDSIGKAELGARIAEETAASLTEIVSGISESAVLINGIAKSSEEQSQGISQINIGIDQVTQVVAQNSATAEESAAASEQMSSQSIALQELISSFKLKETAYLPAYSGNRIFNNRSKNS